jgi:hypothetical protein
MTEFEQKTLEHLAQMNETLAKVLKIMQGFAEKQQQMEREVQRMTALRAQYGQGSKESF